VPQGGRAGGLVCSGSGGGGCGVMLFGLDGRGDCFAPALPADPCRTGMASYRPSPRGPPRWARRSRGRSCKGKQWGLEG
jgi:hypothetical protein